MIRFYEGYGTVKDIDNMQYLAENMLGRTFCPLGDAAAMPMIGFYKKFRDEFESYIKANPLARESQALVELVGA
jgi:NADH-quinone oxidoreductase subunit F